MPEIKEMQKIQTKQTKAGVCQQDAGVCQQDTGDMRQFPKLTT